MSVQNPFLTELKLRTSPMIMGILNVTPDSFSDGGQFTATEHSLNHAKLMVEHGAQIIDIGGESTRPGAVEVNVDDEIKRVIPIIKAIKSECDVYVSVDTSKPEVMRAAALEGVDLINDVRALTLPGALNTACDLQLPVCLMHMQGQPASMQNNPAYHQVVSDVYAYLYERAEHCIKTGIQADHIILDPGFGFGKTMAHNYQLLAQLDVFCKGKYPILSGLSRKTMIGDATGQPVDKRVYGSIAGALISAQKGAKILRVHDVEATRDALAIHSACMNATQK